MKEDQKVIYYMAGESADKIARLPQAEAVLEKGYEILQHPKEGTVSVFLHFTTALYPKPWTVLISKDSQ